MTGINDGVHGAAALSDGDNDNSTSTMCPAPWDKVSTKHLKQGVYADSPL